MNRILVRPDDLEAMGNSLAMSALRLRSIGDHLGAVPSRLDWQVRESVAIEGDAQTARSRALALADQCQSMASFLRMRAVLFRSADARGIGDLAGSAADLRDLMEGYQMGGLGPDARNAARYLRTGALAGGAAATLPVMSAMGLLGGQRPGLFEAPAGPSGDRLPTPSEVQFIQRVLGISEAGYGPKTRQAVRAFQREHGIVPDSKAMIGPRTWSALKAQYDEQGFAPEPEPGADLPVDSDPFWATVGPVPVVDGKFTPEFQGWVDKFNSQVTANWSDDSTDFAGTPADRLVATYQLTPAKVEQLWAFAGENHMDPKLLLAILSQEGTGSFNTNADNSGHYDGHGPQPDWKQDMTAALDSVILGKLRLYPKAVEAGFPGTWLEWINWYTPMDTPWAGGSSGVYASDIHWSAGVENAYRGVADALGSSGDDPVDQYQAYMAGHPDLFQPRNIDDDFVIRQGIAPGDARPRMALPREYPKPTFPATTDTDEEFWWFDAPDEYCWYLERRQGGKA